ncbi:hypothetical protein LXA43DRAFT_468690 [Ganoderma leucocontextum]|nr:hypothetical protein LXA43DRAFT_468690 [Ganoderma leucocontextum]
MQAYGLWDRMTRPFLFPFAMIRADVVTKEFVGPSWSSPPNTVPTETRPLRGARASSLKPRITLSAETVSLSAQSLLREPAHSNHAPSADVLATYRTRRTSMNACDRGPPRSICVRARDWIVPTLRKVLGIASAKRFFDKLRISVWPTHDLRGHNDHPFPESHPAPACRSPAFTSARSYTLGCLPALLALTCSLLTGSLWRPDSVWCFRATLSTQAGCPRTGIRSTTIASCRRPGLPVSCENHCGPTS